MSNPNQSYDSLIVGGGVIGLMTAYELLQRGSRVALIDRQAIGQESSWAGGGILFPVDPGQLCDAGMKLVTWSRKQYSTIVKNLLEETGTDSELIQSGCVVKDNGQGDAIIEWTRSHGLSPKRVNDQEASEIAPALRQGFGGSIWLPGISQVRNPRLLQALKESVIRQGADLYEHFSLNQIAIKNNQVTGVCCKEINIHAKSVIITAGAWTDELMKPLGIALNIEPVRGQMVCFRSTPGLLAPIVMEGDYYVIPRKDGRILAGSTVERVGFNKETTEDALHTLRDAAVRMVPELNNAPVEAHWAGLRPGSPDGVPTIASHPEIKGVFINAGHFRNGLVMAPASARLMAELVLGVEPTFDPKPYSVS